MSDKAEADRQQARRARHDVIAAYAVEMAGTEFDLDAELESAAIEFLLQVDPPSTR
jgi:hypothetical protein